jgi:hypothetical protein
MAETSDTSGFDLKENYRRRKKGKTLRNYRKI